MAKWGEHLILNCASCNENVKSGDAIRAFVKELVERIDMKAYGEPELPHFANHDPSKGGYSLNQFIETSNIAGHFVDSTQDCYLDIFSCKSIPIQVALDVINKHFEPKEITYHFITRGV